MYEKKLRQLFTQAKDQAEAALDEGDQAAAARFYEQCGDILMEQAKNREGDRRAEKEELAEEYYELRDNLVGESDSMRKEVPAGDAATEDQDFDEYVERFVRETDVTWDDVAGLDETKEQLKESFALAAIQDKPPAVEEIHSILLYGPPGTGKTLLASAVAGSHDYPFFDVKLSQALSKYYGESGKIISAIFGAARERAPSILFFDEIDAVAGERGGQMDEPSRRVLSTLLTELSGLNKENDDVMVIAATNAPWDIDPAILSRMERVIHVPLPGAETAAAIVELHTAAQGVELGVDAAAIAEQAVERRYSGREIKNLCRAAIRHMIDEQNPDLGALSERPVEEAREYQLATRALTADDFRAGFEQVQAKTDQNAVERYRDWSPDR